LALWIKLCRQSETILDVGANTGVYALVAGAVNKKAKIFAFEPGVS
jgi:tRNA1(Val) A37 N6-methylase TrmN6